MSNKAINFFDHSVPPLRCKQASLTANGHHSLWYIHWQIGRHRLYSTVYTPLDRACIIWALLLVPMFITAQFSPISWTTQAGLWSMLSLVGLITTGRYAYHWVQVKCISWVAYCWIILILTGLICTDLSIVLVWHHVLAHLCSLWLGLCALGYLFTGLVLHSRAFIATSLMHLLAIRVLLCMNSWQYLFTGTVIVFFLFLLAEFQWDMHYTDRDLTDNKSR
jgi:hypothetical protein